MDLVEPSDFTQSATHTATLEWAMSLPDRDIANLKNLVFAIILPDAVVGGKQHGIIADCERQGYVPIFCELIHNSSERQFEELYIFNHAKTDLGGTWWLNRRIYQAAPVIALVLKKVGPSHTTAHADFRTFKGPSSPYLARPGQLRHDHEAVNRCLSLVHSSDEPLSTVRELKIFVGESGFNEMLATARETGTHEGLLLARAACLAKLERCHLALASFRAETDFLRVLLGLKHRFASAFLRKIGGVGSEMLAAALAAQYKAAFEDYPLLQRTRRFIDACRSEAQVLKGLLPNHTSDPVALSLATMSVPTQFCADAAMTVIHRSKSAEVPMTPWEEVVLLTSMHYWQEVDGALEQVSTVAA